MNERAHGVAFDGASLILQDDDALYVKSGGWTPFATPPDLSPGGHAFPRAGGFYWRPKGSVTLCPFAGSEPLPPVSPLGALTPAYLNDHAAPWRDGAAVAAITTGGSDLKALHVAVTDDGHTTLAKHSYREIGVESNGVSVVTWPDGNSLYVGYLRTSQQGLEDLSYAVSRFDCVSE